MQIYALARTKGLRAAEQKQINKGRDTNAKPPKFTCPIAADECQLVFILVTARSSQQPLITECINYLPLIDLNNSAAKTENEFSASAIRINLRPKVTLKTQYQLPNA
jgi:hypothetical protein